jgi:hypothetical protein
VTKSPQSTGTSLTLTLFCCRGVAAIQLRTEARIPCREVRSPLRYACPLGPLAPGSPCFARWYGPANPTEQIANRQRNYLPDMCQGEFGSVWGRPIRRLIFSLGIAEIEVIDVKIQAAALRQCV